MNALAISLAYKFVAISLMLGEATFFGTQVGLKFDHPLTEADVRAGSHVGPPSTNDFSGSILTDAYFFGFGWGHLANFHRNDLKADSDVAVRERNLKLSKQTSLIDTNGAYQLATMWLAGVGVDVPTLQQKYKLRITQWRYNAPGLTQGPMMLPVYQVEWLGSPLKSSRRRSEMAVVTLTISGVTKELWEYHILDDSLFRRPRLDIANTEQLLSIPDADFQHYSTEQRSNLVAQAVAKAPDAGAQVPK